MGRTWGRAARPLQVTVGVAALAGAFLVGRLTASAGGDPAGSAGDYAAGVQAGEALGVAEGWALQAGTGLPTGAAEAVRRAFTAGYTAGTDDVFSGYDGGWRRGVLYVIALAPARPPLTYRIAARAELHPGTGYELCGAGPRICEHPAAR